MGGETDGQPIAGRGKKTDGIWEGRGRAFRIERESRRGMVHII